MIAGIAVFWTLCTEFFFNLQGHDWPQLKYHTVNPVTFKDCTVRYAHSNLGLLTHASVLVAGGGDSFNAAVFGLQRVIQRFKWPLNSGPCILTVFCNVKK